jgi:hypothetical protein
MLDQFEVLFLLPFVYVAKLMQAHHEFMEDLFHMIPRD